MRKLNILIASRSRSAAELATKLLSGNKQCSTDIRVITNGHVDPLHGLDMAPDLLLMCDMGTESELETLAKLPPEERPALIVFGPGDDAAAVRLPGAYRSAAHILVPVGRA